MFIEDAVGLTLESVTRAGIIEGPNYRFYNSSCFDMKQVDSEQIALTVTSPPYWNAIDYDIHAKDNGAWHREREYGAFGRTYEDYLDNLGRAFSEVLRVTMPGGFCAIVIGTILLNGRHYSAPMAITELMQKMGWLFHQDIIWNKVTGGIRRAGSYIQHPFPGYYYPNIMTEYILIFRKDGTIRRGHNLAVEVDDLFTKDIANNIWHIAPVPPRTINHPCPFPEELARRLVMLYSEAGDTVLDPFLGSGQAALAAVKNGRLCVGYDIEPEYVKLAVERVTMPPPRRKYNLLPSYTKREVKV